VVIDSGKTTLMRMYAILGGLALLIFSWCISGSCYFSANVYRIAAWSMAVFAIMGMVFFAGHLSRNHYIVQTRTGPRKLSTIAIPFNIFMMGCLVGWMCWLVFYALLSLLVFASCRTPSSMLTHLEVIHSGGHCSISYTFYDPSLDRQVGGCGLPYWGASSGDSIRVMREDGPLGMHLDRIARQELDQVH
jgi:hypothetical protein